MRYGAALVSALLVMEVPAALAQTVPVPQKSPGAASPDTAPALPVQPVAPAQTPESIPDAAAMAKLRWSACPALMSGAVSGRLGDPVSEGECGVDSPVLVTAIGAVKLSAESMMSCGMAAALSAWLPKVEAAADEILGSPLSLLVAGSGYECRNRNGAQTGKLSQHAFANAIDIAAFTLADGRSVSVADDWPQPVDAVGSGAPAAQRAANPQARFLARVHGAACALFTTVLGPDADAEHRDHIHLDLGCHGRDCRYLICQ